jgi:hypothetical protein
MVVKMATYLILQPLNCLQNELDVRIHGSEGVTKASEVVVWWIGGQATIWL